MKDLKKIIDRLKNPKVLVLIGAAGVMLIMLSGIFTPSAKARAEPKSLPQSQDLKIYAENYKTALENDIATMLTKMDGVGKAEVLLTISVTEESVSSKNSATFIKMPEIQGAVIVCQGGTSPVVQEKVTLAVASALNLPANRIFVSALTKNMYS